MYTKGIWKKKKKHEFNSHYKSPYHEFVIMSQCIQSMYIAQKKKKKKKKKKLQI